MEEDRAAHADAGGGEGGPVGGGAPCSPTSSRSRSTKRAAATSPRPSASTTASPTSAATWTGSTTTSPAAPSPTASPCTSSKLGDNFKDYGVQHDRVRLIEDTTRRRPGRQGHRLRRRLPHAAGRHRRRPARPQRRRVVHLHPRPVAAHRHQGRPARPTCAKLLHHGYGVHVGFLGHDLHGLQLRARRQALFLHRRPRT